MRHPLNDEFQALPQVPGMLAGVAGKAPQQQDMLLRVAAAGLASLGGPAAPRAGSADDEAVFAAHYKCAI